LRNRIGDALVQKGLVSANQLDAALEKQCDVGGPLGASLLELGFVDERDLGQALSEQLGVRYAPVELLRDLKGPVRKALSRPLLWKHRAVPFMLQGRTLHLLVADVQTLSGLSTKTGYRIVPWLAPEVRVHRELQRHFKIPLSPRYAEIIARLETCEARSATSSPPPTWSRPEPDEAIDRQAGDGERAEQADPCSETPTTQGSDSLQEQLARADDADDAVRVVLDHAIEQMGICILFRVEEGEARIWDVRGHSISPDVRASFVVPAFSGCVLELLTVHPAYRGPVPNEKAYRRFFIELDLEVPDEIVLLPIKVAGQLVAILYGDAGESRVISAPFAEQHRLARKLSLALTMILIRHKIKE
jgi:hypothetical protein